MVGFPIESPDLSNFFFPGFILKSRNNPIFSSVKRNLSISSLIVTGRADKTAGWLELWIISNGIFSLI